MSRPSTTPVLDSESVPRTISGLFTNYELLVRSVEALAFWAAIALPFVYLPLVITGIDTSSEAIAVALLVGLHILTLVLGHQYRSDV